MNRLKEIETRLAAINTELDADDANFEALEAELNELTEERTGIMAKVEKRKALQDNIANMQGANVIETHQKEERNNMSGKFNAESPEYRNAYLKNLLGESLTDVEQRAYVHTTENTGEVIPTELENKIYSNMYESHPILKDVNVLRTGVVLSIVKHVSIVAGDAKQVAENEANVDEQNTFVNVTLSGKDFSKHVDISYRLGKMAIPAFEAYLVEEISARIGSAMADDIVAQITADAHADNKFSTAQEGLDMKDVLKAFGSLKGTNKVFIYANSNTLYNSIASMEGLAEGRLSFVPSPQEAIDARLLGKGIKEEDAVPDGQILVLDPSQFTYNVVQDIMLERDKDIKKHVHTISGFAIAEGTLTNDKAASVVTVTPEAP